MSRIIHLRHCAGRLVDAFVRIVPARLLCSLLTEVAVHRARSLEPAEGLRFLFALDAALYEVEGQLATAYGGGLHTKHRHTGYHDFFVSRVRPGQRVLDVGCGVGALACDLASRAGAQVVGIDLIERSIGIARQCYSHPAVSYMVGDVLQMLPEQQFDVVVLSNVLEHLPDRVPFLTRLRAAVSPSKLLVRVPLFERDWRVPLKRELGVEWRLDLTHETEYTLESFAEEMRQAGFVIRHQAVRWGEIWAEVAPS